MNAVQQQRASDLLWDVWLAGRCVPALPDDVRPDTRAQGYAIQQRIERQSHSPLFGWKIAATSKAGQAHINVDGPLAGRLLRERVRASGDTATFGRHAQMRVAEAEFAFRMARPLLPQSRPYTVDEVLASVATLHPAIELPDSRFDDFTIVGAPQLIADNACAHYFVLGDAAPDSWRTLDLVEHRVVGAVQGKLQREGKGANVLGDPRVALTWLVNELSGLGVTLDAGQVVTTGTCLVPLEIASGDDVRMDFGTLGAVEVRLQ
jgi:2-keto-4-pentenoate hydratase